MADEKEALRPEDAETLRETVAKMRRDQIAKTLEELAQRELSLLEDPRIGGDVEMRQVTIWNAAAMIAAAELLG